MLALPQRQSLGKAELEMQSVKILEDEKIDFIIVGYRGRGIVVRVLLRSVSQEVVRAALRPTLIARKSAGRHQAATGTRSVCNALGILDISDRSP